jgi:hypothetical protein
VQGGWTEGGWSTNGLERQYGPAGAMSQPPSVGSPRDQVWPQRRSTPPRPEDLERCSCATQPPPGTLYVASDGHAALPSQRAAPRHRAYAARWVPGRVPQSPGTPQRSARCARFDSGGAVRGAVRLSGVWERLREELRVQAASASWRIAVQPSAHLLEILERLAGLAPDTRLLAAHVAVERPPVKRSTGRLP